MSENFKRCLQLGIIGEKFVDDNISLIYTNYQYFTNTLTKNSHTNDGVLMSFDTNMIYLVDVKTRPREFDMPCVKMSLSEFLKYTRLSLQFNREFIVIYVDYKFKCVYANLLVDLCANIKCVQKKNRTYPFIKGPQSQNPKTPTSISFDPDLYDNIDDFDCKMRKIFYDLETTSIYFSTCQFYMLFNNIPNMTVKECEDLKTISHENNERYENRKDNIHICSLKDGEFIKLPFYHEEYAKCEFCYHKKYSNCCQDQVRF